MDRERDFRDLEIVVLRNMLSQTTRAYEEKMSELFAEKELAQVTLASIGDAVITTDAKATVTYLNPVAEKLTGWWQAEAEGRSLEEVLLLVDEDQEPVSLDLPLCLKDGRDAVLENEDLTLARRDGQFFRIELRVCPLRGHDKEIFGLALVLQDVSEKKLMELQLTRAAHCDRLTGLLNREAFYTHLRTALEQSGQGEESVLCYLDLDQFKVINDTCGYAAGDLLLQWIGSLIRERVRDSDVLARIGSDEFALLLGGCGLADARSIADNIHRGLQAFRFAWEDRSFNVSLSIGLVPVSPEFKDLMDLLGAADHACYLAKELGRQRTHIYEREEVRLHYGLMHWVMRLQRALDEGRFVLYWQRIRPLQDSARDRQFFEVLVRMQGENEGDEVHEPSEFLTAAERYGLMPAIDRWVVSHTFELLAAQPAEVLEHLDCCSINLSGASVGDSEFLDHITSELKRTGVPAGKICFEITETAAVSHLGRAAKMIRDLSSRSCRWALDDFGSGMSSYRYMQELPVQFLKIDGHIVTDLMTNPLSRAMVKSINQIAHVMGVKTVAEAVSGQAMTTELADIGVDYVQGFWVERPRPIRLPESFHTLPVPSDWHRDAALEGSETAVVDPVRSPVAPAVGTRDTDEPS